MKPMVYKNELTEAEILYYGNYKGHKFFVISYGAYPCCYVAADPERCVNVYGHGSLTCEGVVNFKGHGGIYCIEWDYTHYDDYSGYFPQMGGTKYSTEDLVRHCKQVIDQIETQSED